MVEELRPGDSSRAPYLGPFRLVRECVTKITKCQEEASPGLNAGASSQP